MGSSAPSAKLAEVPDIRRPETEDEARSLIAWANAPHGKEPAATVPQLTRCLEFIASVMPYRKVAEDTGKDRVAVYISMLRDASEPALAYMSRRVCAEKQWFPTPAECLSILKDWRSTPDLRAIAKRFGQDFFQTQMEDFHAALSRGPVDQSVIDEKPDQWKRIAENKGLLRLIDGRFVQRFREIWNNSQECE